MKRKAPQYTMQLWQAVVSASFVVVRGPTRSSELRCKQGNCLTNVRSAEGSLREELEMHNLAPTEALRSQGHPRCVAIVFFPITIPH